MLIRIDCFAAIATATVVENRSVLYNRENLFEHAQKIYTRFFSWAKRKGRL